MPPHKRPVPNNKRTNLALSRFARPEGATFLIETVRKLKLSPTHTLAFRRPNNFDPKTMQRCWNECYSSDVRRVDHSLAVYGTNGGLRNLQRNVADSDLVHILEHFGPVAGFVHRRDSEGLSTGRAFVDFARRDDASACLSGAEW